MLRASDLRTGYGFQVGGYYAPANPSSEAVFTVIAATAQIAPSLEHADTPLDPSSEAQASAEPTLSFMALALACLVPRLGQGHLFHSYLISSYFVLRRMNAAISCKQVGRTGKEALVAGQARWHLPIVRWVAFQHPIPTDNASIRVRPRARSGRE